MLKIYLPCGNLGYITLENVDAFSGEIPLELLQISICNICPDLRECKRWNKRRIRGMRKVLKEFEKYGFKSSPTPIEFLEKSGRNQVKIC